MKTRTLAQADASFAIRIILAVILFNAIIIALPLFYAAWISVHDRDVILRTEEFIGAEHYRRLLTNPEAINAMIASLKFTLVAVVGSLIVGLGMALVLNEDFPGRSFLRAAILIPWAVSEVVTATAWIFMLNPTFGALTGVLHPLGLASENQVWINETTALYWVAAAYVWHVAPLGAFFFLAALQTIPDGLYQAARLDQANVFKRFLHVTLPQIRSTVMVVLVVVTVEAFRSFDLLFAMTRGGPGTASQIFPMLIFRYTFEFSRYGLAAAASFILVGVGVIVTTLYFVILMRRRRTVRIDAPAAAKLADGGAAA